MLPGLEGALHRSPAVSVSGTILGAAPSLPPLAHRAGWASREEEGGGMGMVLY